MVWSQGPPMPGVVYMCPSPRVICVHELEPMFSLGLGKGLVLGTDCTWQGRRMSFSSGCPGLQGMLGWVP